VSRPAAAAAARQGPPRRGAAAEPRLARRSRARAGVRRGAAGIEEGRLAARLTLPVAQARAAVASRAELVALGQEPAVIVAASRAGRAGAAALGALEAFHAKEPLRAAMPREALRDRAFASAPAAAFERVLRDLAAAGRVRLAPDAVALAGHAVRLRPEEEEARLLLTQAARAAGVAGIELAAMAASAGTERALLERVARVLVARRR
jgi:hypothetical protein